MAVTLHVPSYLLQCNVYVLVLKPLKRLATDHTNYVLLDKRATNNQWSFQVNLCAWLRRVTFQLFHVYGFILSAIEVTSAMCMYSSLLL